MKHSNANKTIFASSNIGTSAIKVIRISGPKAKRVSTIFNFVLPKPHQIKLKKLTYNKRLIDRAFVLWMPAPKTYTGEDMVELHVHGSIVIEKLIYEILNKQKSFNLADPGEFTKRAVFNGKIDLTQAEAVNDIISSQTEKQLELANVNLDGQLKRFLDKWRIGILNLLTSVELFIDFSDEDIPSNLEKNFEKNLNLLIVEMVNSVKNSNYNQMIKDGFNVCIIGKPNVGKSELMNKIVSQNVSIVTEIEGTTRDIIEKAINLSGYAICFFDTAGFRNTNSLVEKEGILRTKDKIKTSDIILHLSDNGNFTKPFAFNSEKTIKVSTKYDINKNKYPETDVYISAKKNIGVDQLKKLILKKLKSFEPNENSYIVNLRQINGVKEAIKPLKRILQLSLTTETELVSEELRLASSHIYKITSLIDIEEILDQIFNNFCIGK